MTTRPRIRRKFRMERKRFDRWIVDLERFIRKEQ